MGLARRTEGDDKELHSAPRRCLYSATTPHLKTVPDGWGGRGQHALLLSRGRVENAAAERKYHADLAVREVIPRPDNQRINFFISTGFWQRGTVA